MGSGVVGSRLDSVFTGRTGIRNVDSVIDDFQWRLGSDRVITYSFPTGVAWFEPDYGQGELTKWSELDATLKSAVRSALQDWQRVADIRFVEVAEDQNGAGDLRFALTANMDAGYAAWAYGPGYSAVSGDVWLKTGTFAGRSAERGSFAYSTILHEIGHALGLKHPFEGSPIITSGYDDTNYTVMSYDTAGFEAASPMYYDIAAVQFLYGSNTTANSGDDTYRSGSYSYTIWDTGGTDTIDFSGLTAACSIDLAPGASSLSGSLFVQTMPDVWIENAIGGSGNDWISGNSRDNLLTGGRGADVIAGGAGFDTAAYERSYASYGVTRSGATVSVWDKTYGETDTLTQVEVLRFSDRTVAVPQTFARGDAVGGYVSALRDYGGVDCGATEYWTYDGSADVNGDGRAEMILMNAVNGRWATLGTDASGLIDFSRHGAGGDTRVVGIYIDPSVASGQNALGGPFDSQTRFAADLRAARLDVLGAADYDRNGWTDFYLKVADGNSDRSDDIFLRCIMHADGNINYANYQNRLQMEGFMAAAGVGASVWGEW